jgi:hypothetical protein
MTFFMPFTLSLFQGGQPLDAQLLTAARLHVGAAGIEQTAALERLIAAGQQHTGLVQAVQRVQALLEQAADSEGQRHLLQDSQHLLLVLEELSAVVTSALQQITATPVQSISARNLDDIAIRMQRHLSALETLIATAEESPVIPEESTPALKAILATLRARIAQIATEQRRGHLATLSQLTVQAASELASYEGAPEADRFMELKTVVTELQRQLLTLRRNG